MGTIHVKNRTSLTDFSALFRAALYLSGRKEEAEENSFRIKARKRWAILTVEIKEIEM